MRAKALQHPKHRHSLLHSHACLFALALLPFRTAVVCGRLLCPSVCAVLIVMLCLLPSRPFPSLPNPLLALDTAHPLAHPSTPLEARRSLRRLQAPAVRAVWVIPLLLPHLSPHLRAPPAPCRKLCAKRAKDLGPHHAAILTIVYVVPRSQQQLQLLS